jgi:hypothetical protein
MPSGFNRPFINVADLEKHSFEMKKVRVPFLSPYRSFPALNEAKMTSTEIHRHTRAGSPE